MNQQEINRIKQLDPEGCSGTIQSVLMDKDVTKFSYQEVLFHLLKLTLLEKAAVEKQNAHMASVLKENGLYTSENVLGIKGVRYE